MTHILDEIVEHKKVEVASLKAQLPLEALRACVTTGVARRPFFSLFERGPVLIGEIKPKSPSHGNLTSDPHSIAKLYADSAIDCISVLTDETYFGGSIKLLRDVRSIAPQPIFRKEFVVDVYQIYETAHIGADAVLLIASVLDEETLRLCIDACAECSLGYLVEVHTQEELTVALNVGARIIGINNRNLDTLQIDLSVTETLMHHIPSGVVVVSESGIQAVDDVVQVKRAGVRGILVGASILKSESPLQQIALLKQALK